MKEIMIGTWAWGTGINGSSMIFGKRQNPEILKQAFNEAVKLGFMNWDTAAVYGMGTCEALLGTMINEQEDIFISTKFAPGKKYKKGALSKSFDESILVPCSSISTGIKFPGLFLSSRYTSYVHLQLCAQSPKFALLPAKKSLKKHLPEYPKQIAP